MGVVTELAGAAAEAAPRLLRRFAPSAARLGGTLIEEFTPFARRLAQYGPEAGQIGEDIINARHAGGQVAGTVLQVTRPIVESLTPQESSGLAQVMLGQVPAEHAPALLTPRTVELLRRGAQLSQASGRPFAQELRDQLPQLSPKVVRNGAALYHAAVQNESEAITQRIVNERLAPRALALEDPTARSHANELVNAVVQGTGGNGQLAGLRAFNSATLLGRAVLLNATQTGLSTAVAGFGPTVKALMQQSTSAGRQATSDLAMRLGTASETALGDYIRQDLGTGGLGAKVSSELLRRTGFNVVERMNRRFATAIGDQLFQDAARKAPVSKWAQDMLTRHGVTDLAAPGARDRFIQNFVRRTQFRLTPEELPRMLSQEGWPGELARTAFQFKPFALKATELMLDEMKAQPLGFLGRAVGMGGTLGLAGAQARRLTGGSKKEQTGGIPMRVLEGTLAMGAAGMFSDAIQAAQGGDASLLEFMAGPTASTLAEGGVAGMRALQGRPSKLLRMGVRRIPVVGPALAGQLPHGGGRQQHSILPQ